MLTGIELAAVERFSSEASAFEREEMRWGKAVKMGLQIQGRRAGKVGEDSQIMRVA